MKAPPSNGFLPNSAEGERKLINSELWHACAGPLISLPPVGSLVVYFPQGHSEQVAASMKKETDGVPSYPNLPSKLICMLHNVTLHADPETDEVYAQMTLQPVNKYDQEALLLSDMGLKQSRQPAEFFCKTLTASDTSTHGGFSVPRRAAEKIFPPLDFSMQPPAQELIARDLHDQTWTFKHIYRGQPKRHLLTTGWSVLVSTKRLCAGDCVLFIRDEKSQLLLGTRHANRQQPALSSSVISSDSMHIGILAAAAHAAANNSPFTIFYNPRASRCEFVIPLAKYNKALYNQVSLGMRFRMMFETEESGLRRYMGTITGISDLDPVRWKNSQWRNLQVGWDESTAGERPSRVSIWETEPVVTPFYICPPPFFRPRFPTQPGLQADASNIESTLKRGMPWLDDFGMKDVSNSVFPGLSLVQWLGMPQNQRFSASQSGLFSPASLLDSCSTDDPSKWLNFQAPSLSSPNLQFTKANHPNQQVDEIQQPLLAWSQQQQQQQLLQSTVNLQQHKNSQQQPPPQQGLQQQQQHPQRHHQQQQQQQQLLNHGLQQQQILPQQQQQQQQIVLPALVNNDGTSPNQNSEPEVMYAQLQQQELITRNSQSQKSSVSANRNSSQLASLPQELQFHQQLEQQSSLLQKPVQQPMQMQQAPTQMLQQSLSQMSQVQQSPTQLLHQSLSTMSQLQQAPTQMLQQQSLSQMPQVQHMSQQSLSEQQLQLQMLQKLQQRQQQLLSAVGTFSEPQLPLQQETVQQNRQSQPKITDNGLSTSLPMQSQQFPVIPIPNHRKTIMTIRGQSGITDGADDPSCSTSPSTNNCQVMPSFLNRNQQQGPAVFVGNSVVDPAVNLVQDLQCKSDIQIKNELLISKESERSKFKGNVSDPMEASSSATSYCLDAGGGSQQNFLLPGLCMDGDVELHGRNNLPFAAVNMESLTPDTLLSRDFASSKDIQNLLSNNYGSTTTPRGGDIEAELSSAGINSESFGMPNMSFKPGCSNDVAINDTGAISSGLWTNQTQRMRTYTKVQKRGSVGRTIDVSRYKGYNELRHDLARMFGIEGQLEDTQRTDWKLVYVDHENDILLVGDDPWEEFVSCVQSIKILSYAEVQQMSLDGDLGQPPPSHPPPPPPPPVSNQACSGTESGNAWRGHYYDDNSATSFNK